MEFSSILNTALRTFCHIFSRLILRARAGNVLFIPPWNITLVLHEIYCTCSSFRIHLNTLPRNGSSAVLWLLRKVVKYPLLILSAPSFSGLTINTGEATIYALTFILYWGRVIVVILSVSIFPQMFVCEFPFSPIHMRWLLGWWLFLVAPFFNMSIFLCQFVLQEVLRSAAVHDHWHCRKQSSSLRTATFRTWDADPNTVNEFVFRSIHYETANTLRSAGYIFESMVV